MEGNADYSSTWRSIKLQKLGTTYSGLTGKKKEDFNTGESKFISYMNIYLNPSLKREALLSVKIKAGEKQNKVRYGDLFFTTSSETPDEVGISSVLLEDLGCDAYLNSFCFGFRLHDFKTIDPNFAKYYFRGKPFRKQMFRIAQGATRFNLSKKYFMDTEICIPSTVREQKSIVSILETYDKNLDVLENKISRKKKIKKYIAKELLSEKKRLMGYDQKWESAELADLVKVLTPPHKLQKSQFKSSGTYPIIDQSKNAISGWTDNLNSVLKIQQPVVIFGDHTCILKYVETPFAQGADGIKVLSTRDKLIPAFLYYYLDANPVTLEGYKRHFAKLKMLEVRYPSISEQQAIASVLTSADKEIEILETKKKLVEEQRKYLLNNLITGNIRVPETIGNNLN